MPAVATDEMKISRAASWFGSNGILAAEVGAELEGCVWVGVPFAGGMAKLKHITARTILVNDKHRHVINLARVIKHPELRRELVRNLSRKLFHPDELAEAQEFCAKHEPLGWGDVDCAENYFVCSWMGRSSKGGTDDEFNGRSATRWNSNGGDSPVRFRSAIRSIAGFSRVARRCSFETLDAFEFLDRCEDSPGHGIYDDPPFPRAGRKYTFNCGNTDAEERAWHTRLRDRLARFVNARVVCRFYDVPLIRELYPDGVWHWRYLQGRKQTNEAAPEVLVMSGPSRKGKEQPGGLFS